MHPILYQIPSFPAWLGALLVALLGGVFAWLGRKDPADKGSWWMAGLCGVGAAWLLLALGPSGRVPPLPIRWFGILVVLGFLAAAKVASMRNERMKLLTGEESFDLAFYVLLAGLLGSRTLHVIQNSDQYAGHPVEMVKIWDGGLVWYGGAVASTLYAWYWLARRKKDLWGASDSLALAVPVGHAIGRLGCFMAGCDYGSKVPVPENGTPPWWAVHFPTPVLGQEDPCLVPREFRYDPETDQDVWLHPAQLYESAVLLLLFAILFVVDRRTKGQFRGRLVGLYIALYAVGRAVVEMFRGDADRGTYFGGAISFSQIVSALMFVAGILLYNALRNRARTHPAPAASGPVG
jgi:phosphatidylglycerol:prolipoprotein diacylglycerol transferase